MCFTLIGYKRFAVKIFIKYYGIYGTFGTVFYNLVFVVVVVVMLFSLAVLNNKRKYKQRKFVSDFLIPKISQFKVIPCCTYYGPYENKLLLSNVDVCHKLWNCILHTALRMTHLHERVITYLALSNQNVTFC